MPDAPAMTASPAPSRDAAAETWRAAIVRNLEKMVRRLSVDATRPDAGATLNPKDVLAARRAAKRVRAFAGMAGDDLADLGARTIGAANSVRRKLSATRDETARRAACDRLGVPPAPAPDAPLAPPELADDLRALAALAAEWRTCKPAAIAAQNLFDSIAQTYRKARRRGRKARDKDSAALHRWRRTAVDLEYRAKLLGAFYPALDRVATQADDLRRALGEAHDLDRLMEWADLADAPADADLIARAQARRNQDVADARTVEKQMLETKPKRWAKSIPKSARQSSD